MRTFEIGSGSVSFPDGGLDEPTELGMDWTPTAEGYHIIQVIASPDFKFKAHTNTTRLLLVGDLDTTTITGGMLIDDFDETLMGTPTHISHGGIADGNVVRWELGDIAPGTFGTVSYQVTINSAAEFPPGSAYLFNTAILNADQAVAAGTNELILSNNAPVITGLNVDEMLDENGDVILSGTFSDASIADTHTVQIEWGDGQSDTLTFIAGERSFSIPHAYGVDHAPLAASYIVNLSVTDGTNQQDTDSVTTEVPENQLAPLALADSYAVDQASTLSVGITDSVLTNDTAASSEPLKSLLVTAPEHTSSFTLNDDGTFRVANGKLQIIGNDGNDFVSVSRRGTQVYVEASFLSTTRRWGFGSVSFPLSDVQSIHADMGAGNDIFHVSAFLDLPTIIDGGEGDDILSAGGGPSLIFGGAGNDLLVGGRDRSVLVGGSGRDRLLGVIRSGAQAETRR